MQLLQKRAGKRAFQKKIRKKVFERGEEVPADTAVLRIKRMKAEMSRLLSRAERMPRLSQHLKREALLRSLQMSRSKRSNSAPLYF